MAPFEQPPRPDITDRPIDFEFMPATEWIEFNCELYDVIDELAIEIDRIEAGVLHLLTGQALGLLQVAQHCHLRARDDWHAIIGAHLNKVTSRLAELAEGSSLAVDSPMELSMIDLRVRFVPDDPADREVFSELGVRPYADGIVQALAVDVPGAVRIVPLREIDELGWNIDEAWASAWAQTQSLEQPDEVNVIDVGGADVVHIFGERVFNASLIEQIEDVVGPIGPNGAIVSMPHSHSILVHVIEDITVTIAFNAMIPITRQVYRQGPAEVSPHLYWWRDGHLECVPTYFAQDGVEAYPSAELITVLRTLR